MTTPIIGEGEKLITTVLLNGERLHVRVHQHANGQNVFDAIVHHIGLNEITYFGLMIIKDGEQQFLSLDEKLSKLSKYAPHLWKDDGSCNSSLVFTVFFRVKYYVENICLLQEQQTRHHYYLQLRKDVLENSIRVHDETSMVLASYALQAELGDYDKTVHGYDYFVPQHYLPAKEPKKVGSNTLKRALDTRQLVRVSETPKSCPIHDTKKVCVAQIEGNVNIDHDVSRVFNLNEEEINLLHKLPLINERK